MQFRDRLSVKTVKTPVETIGFENAMGIVSYLVHIREKDDVVRRLEEMLKF